MESQESTQTKKFIYPTIQQIKFIKLQADIDCLLEELRSIIQQKQQDHYGYLEQKAA